MTILQLRLSRERKGEALGCNRFSIETLFENIDIHIDKRESARGVASIGLLAASLESELLLLKCDKAAIYRPG